MTATAIAEQRPLAASETPLALAGMPIVIGHDLHGPLELPALHAAMREVTALHPVLSARLLPSGDGCELRYDPSLPSPVLVPGQDFGTVSAPFALGAPLLRATLTSKDENTHRFLLSVHHAISDGTSVLTLLRTLWESYTARVVGRRAELPPATAGLPQPVEEHFRARFSERDLADFVARRRAEVATLRTVRLPALASGADGPGPRRGVHLRRLLLTPEHARLLARAARSAGTTIHGMLCGIVLCAIREQATALRTPVTMTCVSPLDLRPRLSPPLPRHQLVMAAAATHAVVQVPADARPGRIGRAVWDQLRTAVRDGSVDRAFAALPQVMDEIAQTPMTVSVSNLAARTKPLPLPPELTSEPYWGFVAAPGPLPTVFVLGSHDGGLGVNIVQPRAWFTTEQARRLADTIEGQLNRTCQEPS